MELNWANFHTFVKIVYFDYTLQWLGGRPTGQEYNFRMDLGLTDLTSALTIGKECADLFAQCTGNFIARVDIGKTWHNVLARDVAPTLNANQVLHVVVEVAREVNPNYINFTFEIPGPVAQLTENSAPLIAFVDNFCDVGGFGYGNYMMAESQRGLVKNGNDHAKILAIGYGYSGLVK